ncbi:MAG TPA: Tex-like N-terminal domain-containing protein [Candidatus Hydrogenedentes bacterium]|nr:MAG: General stress protein 13 [Candidatus Hydrogenedentes bacterium ADurb.Bin170]HNZ47372.1 Tex-like N-terminal domain-containing protein [Candidatus Hydrogenedentota bacterium]HOD94059.1 Tex-like N-terminal domain-containing protein [Candidatus Hydrogenedentota bacterium]HOM47640.1 Tex-like N-terminal domain-containing protein [Candidatus Hydrogenedentota bacterium]HOR49467.1 Tex-like N-terminal domain-containing protein [Candidatus Hydrogenedentota bacterium]
MIEKRYIDLIASDENVTPEQVESAISLLNAGATVSFIMRYRKDVTGGLSESKLERISDRNKYYTQLYSKKKSLLHSLEKPDPGQEEKQVVSEEIQAAIDACDDMIVLEDLSLPYKKQRNNHAATAVAKGLLPLANYVWAQAPSLPPPEMYAQSFVSADQKIYSVEEALEGAKHILAECIAMNVDVRKELRKALAEEGRLLVHPTRAEAEKKSKYDAYKDLNVLLAELDAEKLLTILRGEWEAALRVELVIDDEKMLAGIINRFVNDKESAYAVELTGAVNDAYRRLLRPSLEVEVIAQARRNAEDAVIEACREQVRNTLLAAPAGEVPVIAVCSLSPGEYSFVLVDESGALLEDRQVESPNEDVLHADAEAALEALLHKAPAAGIAVSSGPGGRSLLRLIQAYLKKKGHRQSYATLVSDAGLAAYASSPLAAEELPGLKESVRAAVSIARRHQDPLKELIKMDPILLVPGKIAFGVNRRRLLASINRTIESTVNRNGLDVNKSTVEMLRYISGLQFGLAQAIVKTREERGGFTNRTQLMEVPGLDNKIFQQCAGFLRIIGGEQILDASSIHPEAYGTVEKLAASLSLSVAELTQNTEPLNSVRLEDFVDGIIGVMTLEDICYDLGRIGRDSRKKFKAPASFVTLDSIEDLEPGMVLEGLITNVTDFGVFVSLGLPEEGLLHRSEMPRLDIKALKTSILTGEVIKVQVKEVEPSKGKIGLTIRNVAKLPLTRPTGAGRFPKEPWDQRERGRGDRTKRRAPKDSQRAPKQQKEGLHEGSLINTALAEQLAALRNKIISK